MTLREKQSEFACMVADLIHEAAIREYAFTFGDAYRSREYAAMRGKLGTRSLHHKRLAIDLNLFKDGKWLRSTAAHKELGELWESWGGSWGGRFGDGNHYSLAHGGVK